MTTTAWLRDDLPSKCVERVWRRRFPDRSKSSISFLYAPSAPFHSLPTPSAIIRRTSSPIFSPSPAPPPFRGRIPFLPGGARGSFLRGAGGSKKNRQHSFPPPGVSFENCDSNQFPSAIYESFSFPQAFRSRTATPTSSRRPSTSPATSCLSPSLRWALLRPSFQGRIPSPRRPFRWCRRTIRWRLSFPGSRSPMSPVCCYGMWQRSTSMTRR